MKIAVCDSSSFFTNGFIEEIRKIDPKIEVTVFNDFDSLVHAKDLKRYESFFIATEIDRQSGVDVALGIYLETGAEIVFITENCEKYSQNIFEYADRFRPFALLNKPVSRLLLRHIVEMLEHVTGQSQGSNLIVRLTDKDQISLNVSEILYIQHNNRVSYIYTADGNCHESKHDISWFESKLPESFIHCAKSCMVNALKVRSMDDLRIVFSDDCSAWCSRRYKKEFVESLEKYNNRKQQMK